MTTYDAAMWKSRRHLEQLVEAKNAIISDQRQTICNQRELLVDLARERDFFDDANQKLGREIVDIRRENNVLDNTVRALRELRSELSAGLTRASLNAGLAHRKNEEEILALKDALTNVSEELADARRNLSDAHLSATAMQNGGALEIYKLEQRLNALEQSNAELKDDLEQSRAVVVELTRKRNELSYELQQAKSNVSLAVDKKANMVLSQQVDTLQSMLGKINQVVSASGMVDDETHTVFGVMAMQQEILGLAEALAACDPWVEDPPYSELRHCAICHAPAGPKDEHYPNCAWKAANRKLRIPTSRRLAQLEMQLEYTANLYNSARRWARIWKRSAKEHREIFNALADVKVGDVIDRIKTVRSRVGKIEVIDK